MKTLGYYDDQVSREVMTQRIASRVKLVDASTPTTTQPGRTDTVWVETQHPVDHELDVTWAVDGANLAAGNARSLDLATLNLAAGTHSLTATVVDPTTFVRDPAIRNATALTQKLTWTIKDGVNDPVTVTPAITRSTSTAKPVGRNDVVYVETTHPDGPVTWTLDGAAVGGTAKNLRLSNLSIGSGSHTLVAKYGDDTRTWKVDAIEPTTTYTVFTPRAVLSRPGAEVPEYIFEGPFSMKLTATDDDPGYVVPEFRVDGDGWQNSYGWPTDATAPFQFSGTGRQRRRAEALHRQLHRPGEERGRRSRRHRPGNPLADAFSLPQPLKVKASSPLGSGGALGPLGTVLTYSTPASHDPVTVSFRQTIGANDALRTGSYSKTLTFTLSTTSP